MAIGGVRLAHPATGYLSSMVRDKDYGDAARFFLNALENIEDELACPDEDLVSKAHDLADYLGKYPNMRSVETVERFWNVFFPEGVVFLKRYREAVRELRERRTVIIGEPAVNPITRPHEEILFTSNVLMTLPLLENLETLPISEAIRKVLLRATGEDQVYWYDHPIPVGIENKRNEAVYGLRGLDDAVRFEVERGNTPAGTRLPVLLSISTTHHGLQGLARDYLSEELGRAGGVDHLEIFAASQRDVRELLETVLIPAAGHFFPDRDVQPLSDVLGVDGEYGRHYSFLKASAALWHVLLDSRIRATFKFDLDQVFPQSALVEETGRSAFEHMCDRIWGATGVDHRGEAVELGMLAGALVDERDADEGLFTPDVRKPEGDLTADQWIFASTWPQAASTEAEMMAQYGRGGPDGKGKCYQRVHVTGGTTGILVDSLRRHRPFTPSWVGRAEDQAYLLSVLFPDKGPALRYAHGSGLIMRHDKMAFAGDAMKAARIGKMVGDNVRILTFTSYAKALPWAVADIKGMMDPFTGSFISRLPVTISCLRMAIQAAVLFSRESESAHREGEQLVRVGAVRLGEAINLMSDEKGVRTRYLGEKAGWDLYYDMLDELERGLETRDRFSEGLRDRTRDLVERWRVTL